jgi:hypothetical protein
MKRTIIYLIAALFLFSATGPVFAVDKKEKDKSKTQETDRKQSPRKDTSDRSSKAQQSKKYDDFIDNNHNGIDDRRENLKKKQAPAPEKSPDSSSKDKGKP